MTTTATILVIAALWVFIAFAIGIVIGRALRRADRRSRTADEPRQGGMIIELDEQNEPKPPITPPGHPRVTWHEWWWQPPGDDDPRMN